MTDASDADRWEQAQPVGDEAVDDEPAIDLERAEGDALEQARVVPGDDEEHPT